MRLVRRKTTRRSQPRPPWDWKETAERGAPRVLLSNQKDPITVAYGDSRIRVGRLDWLLRLYQHKGVTKNSALQEIDGELHVCYEGEEWEKVRDVADWLELVNDSAESVCRTDMRSGRKYGHRIELARGPGWAVPLHHYSTHTQE